MPRDIYPTCGRRRVLTGVAGMALLAGCADDELLSETVDVDYDDDNDGDDESDSNEAKGPAKPEDLKPEPEPELVEEEERKNETESDDTPSTIVEDDLDDAGDDADSDANSEPESKSNGTSDNDTPDNDDDLGPEPGPKPEPKPESNGLLVFTYDDGPVEDYTKTFPVHDEYDAPACVAVNPGNMGESSDWLTPSQLRTLVDAGWGVMSHTYRHRAFGEIRLTHEVSVGDRKVYVERNTHGRFAGDPLVITDESTYIEARVAGRGRDLTGRYIELTAPVEVDIWSDGVTHHPKDYLQEKLKQTDQQLADWGFDVFGFVYPYDRYHSVAEEVAREHYSAVANHRWSQGCNHVSTNPSEWRRQYVDPQNLTDAEVETFLDTAVEQDCVAILGAHSQYESWTPERCRFIIEQAQQRGLEIVTMQEAAERTAHHR